MHMHHCPCISTDKKLRNIHVGEFEDLNPEIFMRTNELWEYCWSWCQV